MSNEPNAEAVKDAHDHLKAYIAETVGVPTAIYKAMHALTYAMLSRDEPQGADMMQRCTDMLADVPGATLEDKMTKYIGEYMALQLASRSQAGSVPRAAQDRDQLGRLWQAIIDNTRGDGFWIGEILLDTIQRETGFDGSALTRPDREMFKCNCPHEVRSGCSEPKCPHYAPLHPSHQLSPQESRND